MLNGSTFSCHEKITGSNPAAPALSFKRYMTAQEFLKKSLKEWCTRFEDIKVRYAYDAEAEYHIVEVEPEAVRRGNAEYKQAEMELWLSFMEFYPEENLLITSPISYCSF